MCVKVWSVVPTLGKWGGGNGSGGGVKIDDFFVCLTHIAA